jgi:hypothetical protein
MVYFRNEARANRVLVVGIFVPTSHDGLGEVNSVRTTLAFHNPRLVPDRSAR